MAKFHEGKNEQIKEMNQTYVIGQKLRLLQGDRSTQEHPSGGFHRLALRALGYEEINRILGVTNDAFQRSMADPGNKPVNPDRYFGGTVMKILEARGISLSDFKILPGNDQNPLE